MNKLAFLFCIALLLITTGSDCTAEVQIKTGLNFDWWSDSSDNDARQFFVPIRIDARAGDFSATLLTAYADTRLDASGRGAVSLNHLLDTKLISSYEIVGKLPVDILFGLDLNLPTGKTNLSRRNLALIMDPDLISINNFGEGFNVNPTLTVSKEWRDFTAGIGIGYLWRGKYDFSSELNITDYEPGDVLNARGEIRYYLSSDLFTRLFGSHSWYGKDKVRGVDFYQEGDFSLFGLGLNYSDKHKWDADFTFRGIFRDKSKFQTVPGALASEPGNSHGDEWIGDIVFRYFPDERTALRTYFQGRFFTKNDYSSDSSRFVGRKEKFSIGVGGTRALTRHIEAGLDVRGFFKDDAEAHFPEFETSRDFAGVSVALTLAGTF